LNSRTIELEEERLTIVKKHFGDVLLSAITATTIAEFQTISKSSDGHSATHLLRDQFSFSISGILGHELRVLFGDLHASIGTAGQRARPATASRRRNSSPATEYGRLPAE